MRLLCSKTNVSTQQNIYQIHFTPELPFQTALSTHFIPFPYRSEKKYLRKWADPCVCLRASLHLASMEQLSGVVCKRKSAILKIEQCNMSENSEMIFGAPANRKSNVWNTFGFSKKEGNIDKSLAPR